MTPRERVRGRLDERRQVCRLERVPQAKLRLTWNPLPPLLSREPEERIRRRRSAPSRSSTVTLVGCCSSRDSCVVDVQEDLECVPGHRESPPGANIDPVSIGPYAHCVRPVLHVLHRVGTGADCSADGSASSISPFWSASDAAVPHGERRAAHVPNGRCERRPRVFGSSVFLRSPAAKRRRCIRRKKTEWFERERRRAREG